MKRRHISVVYVLRAPQASVIAGGAGVPWSETGEGAFPNGLFR